MNLFKNQIMYLFGIYFLCLIPTHCHANQIDTVELIEKKIHLVSVDNKKITAHEQYVARAQKRYRYIKPLLTAGGITCVLGYFWYTSSSLSREEIEKIRSDWANDPTKKVAEKDWFKSSVTSIGGVAVELIGGALIIPPLSDFIGKLTGCAHIMSSLELYDKEYTHCNALITQMARDMQMNLASEASGKNVAIGAHEVVNATNRLVRRIEKLLGFMHVEVGKFSVRLLRQEAQAIEKRLICYTNELSYEIQCALDQPALNNAAVLELIVQFAQRYAQEMQRFSFLEQDAREDA